MILKSIYFFASSNNSIEGLGKNMTKITSQDPNLKFRRD